MIPVSSSNHEQGCSSVSSNCVIWQGPDIPCLSICKGDSVSTVVADLATQLCTLLGELKLEAFDLTCLNLNAQSTPENITELIQVIIDKSCSLDSRCSDLEAGSGSGSSSSVVTATLPVCLHYVNPENDLITELPVDQYAELAAAKICELIDDVAALQTTVNNHETRITTLEGNTVTQYTTPQITPSCVLPAVPTDIDVVLDELEDQFCVLNNALGGSTALQASSTYQCDLLSTDSRLAGSGTMSTIEGWNTNVSNVAESLQNLWLTLCDMRAAIKDIQTNCCSISCNDVVFAAQGSYTSGIITFDFAGSVVPDGFTPCNAEGALTVITDAANNTFTTRVPVVTALAGDGTDTVDISTSSLSELSNYSVTITLCVSNGSFTCEKTLTFDVTNDASSCAVPTGITATIE